MKKRYKKELDKLVEKPVEIEKIFADKSDPSKFSARLNYSIRLRNKSVKYVVGRSFNNFKGSIYTFEWTVDGNWRILRILFKVLGLKKEGEKLLNEIEV